MIAWMVGIILGFLVLTIMSVYELRTTDNIIESKEALSQVWSGSWVLFFWLPVLILLAFLYVVQKLYALGVVIVNRYIIPKRIEEEIHVEYEDIDDLDEIVYEDT